MNTESTEKKNESPAEEVKKRVAAGAVALVTSASMLVGGIFSPPADLPDGADLAPAAVCSEDDGDDDLSGGGGDGGSGEERGGERERTQERGPGERPLTDEERMGVRARLQKWLSARPLGLRLLAVLPIWLIAFGLASLIGAALPALMSPLLARLVGWVLLALAMVAAFALTAKTLFPELPLKKILSRRNLSGVLIAAAVIALADAVLPLLWSGYGRLEAAVRGAGGLLAVGAAALGLMRRQRGQAKTGADEEPEESEEQEEEPRPLSRQEILEMVDSVGKRR